MRLKKQSALFLLPLLMIYIIIAFFVINNELGGDQERYLIYAKNLLKGSYAIDGPLFLWNGPGYPIILAPFVGLNLGVAGLKSLNIIFLFFGVVLFYKTCLQFFNKKQALLFSYLLGLYYPNILFSIRYILTEAFAFFLACGLLYFISLYLKKTSTRRLFLAAFFFAFLILTKVIFAYVVLATAVILLLTTIKSPKKPIFNYLAICLLASTITLPYLFYTYNLTGKFPYYSNAGGQCVYWLSTPYENEYGEWIYANSQSFKNSPQFKNHNSYLSSIDHLKPVEKDQALKQKAVINIKNNPKKFIKNYISNISRLFLNIPNSYSYENFSFILLAIPNSFIFVFLCISILLTILLKNKIPITIYISALLVIIYLFGSSLLCAYPRMLFPILPFLFFWIFYMIKEWKNRSQPKQLI